MKKTFVFVLAVTAMFFFGCKPENGGNGGNDGSDTYDGYEYVDLDLPSGTLWATCNLGAETPYEYGDYYAWGETEPKTLFKWSNYKYGSAYNKLTKYCYDPEFGLNEFVDNMTELLPEDDAATVQMGSGWRIPTIAQWRELMDNTDNEWKKVNGVNGWRFVGPNGKTLFLPACGSYSEQNTYGGTEPLYEDRLGSYWANSIYDASDLDYTCYAWHFEFDAFPSCQMYSYHRSDGYSIRPVRVSY